MANITVCALETEHEKTVHSIWHHVELGHLGLLTYTDAPRPVVPRGAGGAMASPDFGRSVNPISTRGGQIMPTK